MEELAALVDPLYSWLPPALRDVFPRNYLVTLWVHNVVLAVACYLLGLWVVRRGVRVNYTRKLNHFAIFLVPIGLAPLLPYEPSAATITGSMIVFVITTLVFLRPIRQRVGLFETMFAGVDRPEDRPHTLAWILSQALAAYAALVSMLFLMRWLGRPELVALPLLVTAIGDGLAEPVGVRFGKHRYRVPSLVSGRTYTRSWEGSTCVLLAGLLMTIAFAKFLPGPRLWATLATLPPAMTLAEAWSPHSWDAPLLYLTGGGVLATVLWIWPVMV